MELATLFVKVDAKDATRQVDALNKSLGTTVPAADKAGLALKAVAAGGALALAGALRKVITESAQAQYVQAQLAAGLTSTGNASRQTVASLNLQASALQRMTVYSDEAVGSAQSILLTFTKISGDTFPRAIRAIADMSARMGGGAGSLSSAALQVGKALNEPTEALSSLTRAGVQFSTEQKRTIENMVALNNVAGAQSVILAELERQFGGSAAAARNTLGGAIEGLKNQIGELFEADAGQTSSLITAIESITSGVQKLGIALGGLNDIATRLRLIDGPAGARAGDGAGPLTITTARDRGLFGSIGASPIVITAEMTEEGKRRAAWEEARRNAAERKRWEEEEEARAYRLAQARRVAVLAGLPPALITQNTTAYRAAISGILPPGFTPGAPATIGQIRGTVVPGGRPVSDADRQRERDNIEIARNFRENMQRAVGDIFTEFVRTGSLSVRSIFASIGDVGSSLVGQTLSSGISSTLGKLGGGSFLGNLATGGVLSIVGGFLSGMGDAARQLRAFRNAVEDAGRSTTAWLRDTLKQGLSPAERERADLEDRRTSGAQGILDASRFRNTDLTFENFERDLATFIARIAAIPGNTAQAQVERRDGQQVIAELQRLREAFGASLAANARARNLETANGLGDYARGLNLSSASPLSVTAQLREARERYASLLRRADGGDQSAADQLTGAADTFLSLSRRVNASGARYTDDFATVKADALRVEALFRERATVAEATRDAAQDTADNTARANEVLSDGFTTLGTALSRMADDVAALVVWNRQTAEALL
jgi:hypothetical protein